MTKKLIYISFNHGYYNNHYVLYTSLLYILYYNLNNLSLPKDEAYFN
jgi:hypothetical protein